jgi:hypothetical protein
LLLIVATQITPGAAASWSSWSGCFEGGVDETSDAAGGAGLNKGCSSIQAIPAGAWEVSTWSTRSAASMNDVDADEHWQTIGRRGTAPAGRGGAWLAPC